VKPPATVVNQPIQTVNISGWRFSKLSFFGKAMVSMVSGWHARFSFGFFRFGLFKGAGGKITWSTAAATATGNNDNNNNNNNIGNSKRKEKVVWTEGGMVQMNLWVG